MTETKSQLSEYATLSEAAKLAGITTRTLSNHMKDQTAPGSVRKGREVLFLITEVQAWAERNYPAGAPRKGRRKK